MCSTPTPDEMAEKWPFEMKEQLWDFVPLHRKWWISTVSSNDLDDEDDDRGDQIPSCSKNQNDLTLHQHRVASFKRSVIPVPWKRSEWCRRWLIEEVALKRNWRALEWLLECRDHWPHWEFVWGKLLHQPMNFTHAEFVSICLVQRKSTTLSNLSSLAGHCQNWLTLTDVLVNLLLRDVYYPDFYWEHHQALTRWHTLVHQVTWMKNAPLNERAKSTRSPRGLWRGPLKNNHAQPKYSLYLADLVAIHGGMDAIREFRQVMDGNPRASLGWRMRGWAWWWCVHTNKENVGDGVSLWTPPFEVQIKQDDDWYLGIVAQVVKFIPSSSSFSSLEPSSGIEVHLPLIRRLERNYRYHQFLLNLPLVYQLLKRPFIPTFQEAHRVFGLTLEEQRDNLPTLQKKWCRWAGLTCSRPRTLERFLSRMPTQAQMEENHERLPDMSIDMKIELWLGQMRSHHGQVTCLSLSDDDQPVWRWQISPWEAVCQIETRKFSEALKSLCPKPWKVLQSLERVAREKGFASLAELVGLTFSRHWMRRSACFLRKILEVMQPQRLLRTLDHPPDHPDTTPLQIQNAKGFFGIMFLFDQRELFMERLDALNPSGQAEVMNFLGYFLGASDYRMNVMWRHHGSDPELRLLQWFCRQVEVPDREWFLGSALLRSGRQKLLKNVLKVLWPSSSKGSEISDRFMIMSGILSKMSKMELGQLVLNRHASRLVIREHSGKLPDLQPLWWNHRDPKVQEWWWRNLMHHHPSQGSRTELRDRISELMARSVSMTNHHVPFTRLNRSCIEMIELASGSPPEESPQAWLVPRIDRATWQMIFEGVVSSSLRLWCKQRLGPLAQEHPPSGSTLMDAACSKGSAHVLRWMRSEQPTWSYPRISWRFFISRLVSEYREDFLYLTFRLLDQDPAEFAELIEENLRRMRPPSVIASSRLTN